MSTHDDTGEKIKVLVITAKNKINDIPFPDYFFLHHMLPPNQSLDDGDFHSK